ncbi:GntR family transcriptional regulator [Kushneria sp. Sum13]|uniref:GntR family transcriptional regulator n=1 Tax=Kushneria sp. Sum13 TaxID=3459196 RepID=UPI0040453440
MTRTQGLSEAAGTISRHSLHDAITNRLRDMIIEGELEQGARIYEGPLCETLGVSRTPLREALRFLASEGLVELVPQRGARVRQFSARDIEDMLVLIRSLEELAARIACDRASDDEIKEVRRLHDQMVAYYHSGNRLDYYKTNQQIHTAIVALAHNEPLAQVHTSLQSKLKRIRFIGHDGPEKWASAVHEHEMIMAALERRDAETLVAALGEHLGYAWQRVRHMV